jgi:hypothetical protein
VGIEKDPQYEETEDERNLFEFYEGFNPLAF